MIDFYCIYKKDDVRSTALALDAIDSAANFDITVNLFEGIYSNFQKHLTEEGLVINKTALHKIRSEGVLGCFLSHYYLWKKCLDLNFPIGILEYDAYFINRIPDNFLDNFNDCCNLDYTRHLYLSSGVDKYTSNLIENSSFIDVCKLKENTKHSLESFKYINNNHIKGAFGYVIKPAGAKKLIAASKKFGILPADVQINLKYCNIYYTTPSIVMLNKKSLIKKVSHTNT